MKRSAKVFIGLILLSGLAVLVNGVLHFHAQDGGRFVSFLLAACLAARLKITLPRLTGNMSVNLPFILVAAAVMTSAEALLIACISTWVQCLPRGTQRFNAVQAIFNFGNVALAVGATRLCLGSSALTSSINSYAFLLSLSAAAFFVANTVPVAIVISLTESKNGLKVWSDIFQLSFPYFVASAGISGIVLSAAAKVGWQIPMFVLPVMLGIFVSYRRYFGSSRETAVPPSASVRAVAAG